MYQNNDSVDWLESNKDGPCPFSASRNIFSARLARKCEFIQSVHPYLRT